MKLGSPMHRHRLVCLGFVIVALITLQMGGSGVSSSCVGGTVNNTRVYWSEPGLIKSAQLDGSDIQEEFHVRGVPFGLSVAGDVAYWIEQDNATTTLGSIVRGHLNSTMPLETVVPTVYGASGLAFDPCGMKLYWLEDPDGCGCVKGGIVNANPQNFSQLGLASVTGSAGVALDFSNGWVYSAGRSPNDNRRGASWLHTIASSSSDGGDQTGFVDISKNTSMSISRTRFDGEQGSVLVSMASAALSVGVAVDSRDGSVFWSDGQTGIWRSNLDGTNPTSIYQRTKGTMGPGQLAARHSYLFWFEQDDEYTYMNRAFYNGTNVQTIVIEISDQAWGLTVNLE